ncbi:MAG: fimbrillin family protein [Tannerellaceae bacterium]|nr:fimbrillin family protein [Tannerellaceae bacterium]
MTRKLYILMLLAGILLGHVACSDKQEPLQPDEENSINLYGLGTRADGDVYTNLHLKAFVEGNLTELYIAETPIAVAAGLYEATPNNITFTSGNHYYPLGNNTIALYAYSGQLTNTTQMQLTSGKALTNDALLSNYGTRSDGTTSNEGEGTLGSSQEPATIMQFRHVMTQINVEIEVDLTETPVVVDPPPTSIRFQMGTNIPATGRYAIDAETTDLATNLSGSYTLTEGINYVVPSGGDITTFAFTELIIDDYRATADDLDGLRISNLNISSPAPLLMPGYAYNITFLVQRLRVEAITIELVPWNAREVNNEPITYDPYILDLDLGDYVNSGADQIEKVVLYTTDSLEYVGGLDDDGISFVNLPATAEVDSVDLYTSLGLLISLPLQTTDYTLDSGTKTGTLTALLSEGGMRLENPGQPPAPGNPYLISTPVQVFNIAKDLTASYKQVNDLDIDRLNYTTSSPLVPLETFEGVFDGNGYQIQNLVMTGPALIERNEGTLKNLRIASGRIDATGQCVAGSFCAVNAGTIVACINEARIVNATNIVGGICGTNEDNAKVIGCINTGNLENGVILGGICGQNNDADIYTFVSCINIGLLTKSGTTLGGMIGTTVDSPDPVVSTSFWLVGTAAKTFGGPETSVGSGFIGDDDVSALSPEKLRNDLSALERDTDAETTVILLNTALQNYTTWGDQYHYVLDQEETGSVWPIPQKITP